MKCRYSSKDKLNDIMQKEVKAYILKEQRKFDRSFEAMTAWAIYKTFGCSIKKLEKFRDEYVRLYKEMCERYECNDTFPAEIKLEQLGYHFYNKENKDNNDEH